MNNIIFGPVTSRRFGKSLGIDLSPSKKQCNFDCLYCELEGSKPVNSMDDAVDVELVIAELKKALVRYKDIDVITITANGEPTLYPCLDRLVDEINLIKQSHKLLILSNSANITKKNIRQTLSKIDIVKLSLDCISPECFRKIDRPLKSIDINDIVNALKEFRKTYKGSLIIEILVVKGINDKSVEFEKLNKILQEIKPDRIDVGTIDRPPAYRVEGVSMGRLKELSAILEGLHVSIAYKKDYKGKKLDFSEKEILNLLKKRPQSFSDIESMFSDKSKNILESLYQSGVVTIKEVAGVKFYGTGG